jgi:hypothetical protein
VALPPPPGQTQACRNSQELRGKLPSLGTCLAPRGRLVCHVGHLDGSCGGCDGGDGLGGGEEDEGDRKSAEVMVKVIKALKERRITHAERNAT